MKPTDVPVEPSHRWEWIKYQLRSRGSSFVKLADELGVVSSAVKDVKRGPYPRMERAIAKKIGLPPFVIWPERWNADGTPHRQRPNRPEQLASYRNCNFDTNWSDDSGSSANAHRQCVTGA